MEVCSRVRKVFRASADGRKFLSVWMRTDFVKVCEIFELLVYATKN